MAGRSLPAMALARNRISLDIHVAGGHRTGQVDAAGAGCRQARGDVLLPALKDDDPNYTLRELLTDFADANRHTL